MDIEGGGGDSRRLLMQEATSKTGAGDRTKAAEYLADLTGDLAPIAREHKIHTLGYLLEMARLEAQNLAGLLVL